MLEHVATLPKILPKSDGGTSDGLRSLISAGAQLVLCRGATAATPEAAKEPVGKWAERWPTLTQALDAVVRGCFVGLVPASIGLVCFDVDAGGRGGVERLTKRLGVPVAVIPTRKRGHFHVFYRVADGFETRNGRWSLGKAGGDVRFTGGYVVLWNIEALAFALFAAATSSVPISSDDVDRLQVSATASAVAEQVVMFAEPPRPRPRPKTDGSGGGLDVVWCCRGGWKTRLANTPVGGRNRQLMLELLAVLRRPACWPLLEQDTLASFIGLGRAMNGYYSTPLPDDEARKVAANAWQRKRDEIETGEAQANLSADQRRRRLGYRRDRNGKLYQSNKARANVTRREWKDASIKAMLEAGGTYREAADEHAVSLWRVGVARKRARQSLVDQLLALKPTERQRRRERVLKLLEDGATLAAAAAAAGVSRATAKRIKKAASR